MKTANRGRSAQRRPVNNQTKSQNDDDNCSVVCYKDSDDDHVGVVRIRQQLTCVACNLMRGTLASYAKHLLENNHRDKVKKLCEENRFVPTVFDKAVQLAFQNNFYYQSDQFHFLYKHVNDESDASLCQTDAVATNGTRKRRALQVKLVFQKKTYSRTGAASALIREQLLQDMVADRASDLDAITLDMYYTKKKSASDANHPNAQKSSVIASVANEQSQAMLKKQQPESQEPFTNGKSPARTSREDNGVEQNPTAMITDELSSVTDDVTNVCKDALQHVVLDVYSQSNEFKREQQLLSGMARRSFKKKNTFICDICSIFLTSEKYCTQHLQSSEHAEKVSRYQTDFLPWRRTMQQSIIQGRSMKEIMGSQGYEEYKATMATYLAPNSLSNRGRFFCAYCELAFPDQWALEKHLHTDSHAKKKASFDQVDHKELVVRFANVVVLPLVFKLNGITQLADIPSDVKTRNQWCCVTRAQLDDDTATFLRLYPLDTCEGASRLVNTKAPRKQQKTANKPSVPNVARNSRANYTQGRDAGGFARTRSTPYQAPSVPRGLPMKRPLMSITPDNKRFRSDLNNSFPGANQYQGPGDNYGNRPPYNYNQPEPVYNGNGGWPSRHPRDHQRQEVFERSNFALQSIASTGNDYRGERSFQPMHTGNQYNHEQQSPFNGGMQHFNGQPSNYNHAFDRPESAYHHEAKPPSLLPPPHRMNLMPINDRIQNAPNNLPAPRTQVPLMPPAEPFHSHNQNLFGAFAGNQQTNHTQSPFSPSNGISQANQMRNNGPPMRSYSDYRTPTDHTRSSMHPSSAYPANSAPPQRRTFDEFGLSNLAHNSSNSVRRSDAPLMSRPEPSFGHFGHSNSLEQPGRAPWNGPSRGANHSTRGRGGQFQPTNKNVGVTFSYSSTSNNNNHSNNTPMRGQGAAGRSFGNRP